MGAVLSTLRFGLRLLGLLAPSTQSDCAVETRSHKPTSAAANVISPSCQLNNSGSSSPDDQTQDASSPDTSTQSPHLAHKPEPHKPQNKLTAQSNHQPNPQPENLILLNTDSSIAGNKVTNASTNSSAPARPALMQSIPVGQSLDSPDTPDETPTIAVNDVVSEVKEPEPVAGQQNSFQAQHRAAANAPRLAANNASQPPQAQNVEEAVIKIQALVRGHLARKALKGVDGLPLGQRQFDDKSLSNRNYLSLAESLINSSTPLPTLSEEEPVDNAAETSEALTEASEAAAVEAPAELSSEPLINTPEALEQQASQIEEPISESLLVESKSESPASSTPCLPRGVIESEPLDSAPSLEAQPSPSSTTDESPACRLPSPADQTTQLTTTTNNSTDSSPENQALVADSSTDQNSPQLCETPNSTESTIATSTTAQCQRETSPEQANGDSNEKRKRKRNKNKNKNKNNNNNKSQEQQSSNSQGDDEVVCSINSAALTTHPDDDSCLVDVSASRDSKHPSKKEDEKQDERAQELDEEQKVGSSNEPKLSPALETTNSSF